MGTMDGGQVMLATCYTVGQVMEATGRSQITIYRDIKSGKLSAHKVGKHWCITQDEFDAYIKGQRYDAEKYTEPTYKDVLASVSTSAPLMSDAEIVRLIRAIVSDDANRIAQSL